MTTSDKSSSSNSSSSSSNFSLLQKNRVLAVMAAGAISGLIGSLAISSLILLAEKVATLPIGSFYMMLISAIWHSPNYSIYSVLQGLVLHLVAGTIIGVVISVPFAVSRKASLSLDKLAPAYGLGVGVLLWAVLFLPITYWVMMPLMQSLDGKSAINQSLPIGIPLRLAVSDMLALIGKIVYAALAFNMLFGLIVLVLTRAFANTMVAIKSR